MNRLKFEFFSASSVEWNDLIQTLPEPHILQTEEWKQIKKQFGWEPYQYIWSNSNQIFAAALVLKRTISVVPPSIQASVLYVPKGPLLVDWNDVDLRNNVIADLQEIAKLHRAMFIKIDPDIQVGTGLPGECGPDELGIKISTELAGEGWQYSGDQIQYKNTVILDLNSSEDELLRRMKQKTRYNIRLASRKGVRVRIGNSSDFEMLFRMYAETSVRDNFAIREAGYYKRLWNLFYRAGMVEPLIAEVEDNPVAGLMLYFFGRKAYYMQGMSTSLHREKMPNYMLQWEAMKRAKERDCVVYDLWGAPENFTSDDPMWNVYRFKSGFGGELIRHIGAWDLVINKLQYWIYLRALPLGMNLLRRRGKTVTRDVIGMNGESLT
jgi:lipid II:glycine glycyltransferase (peptidoglycan interpeptide bridge formation enzyme)